MTLSDVAEADVTVAVVAPKKTMLFDGVALKPVPVMVTTVPTGPDAGEKPEIVCAADASENTRSTNSQTPLPAIWAVVVFMNGNSSIKVVRCCGERNDKSHFRP